jgi:hypothetical protein
MHFHSMRVYGNQCPIQPSRPPNLTNAHGFLGVLIQARLSLMQLSDALLWAYLTRDGLWLTDVVLVLLQSNLSYKYLSLAK